MIRGWRFLATDSEPLRKELRRKVALYASLLTALQYAEGRWLYRAAITDSRKRTPNSWTAYSFRWTRRLDAGDLLADFVVTMLGEAMSVARQARYEAPPAVERAHTALAAGDAGAARALLPDLCREATSHILMTSDASVQFHLRQLAVTATRMLTEPRKVELDGYAAYVASRRVHELAALRVAGKRDLSDREKVQLFERHEALLRAALERASVARAVGIRICLTEDERRRLKAMAAERHETLSDFVRRRAFAPQPMEREETDEGEEGIA